MMRKKIRVGVLFGGKSSEHEISLLSAKNIIEALDQNKYEVVLISIDKEGQWHLRQRHDYLAESHHPKSIHLSGMAQPVGPFALPCDLIFPILHGTNGEDGTVQGLLKLAGLPFVGAGVLGSAIGMDKDVMKRLLQGSGIQVAKFIAIHQHTAHQFTFDMLQKELGLPFFVKPANGGSSIGISKVATREEFAEAALLAFQYDRKILIEEAIVGREIECSVLGNDYPMVSLPGEVIPAPTEFHSYDAKYVEGSGATFKLPVELPPDLLTKVHTIVLKTYRALCAEGMARVDLFLKENGEVVVNEINTIPGFTNLSVYPKLWEATGLPLPQLLDRLIQLALERDQREKQLKTMAAFHAAV